MSLTAVAEELGFTVERRPAALNGDALCFVINKKYITPFKALVYSMLETGSFLDLPILMISDEEEVFADPFIARVVDKKKFVTQQDKDTFRQVIGTKVKDTYRLEWIAKYTFLKWLMYDDFGYDRLVYIDSDMVFTNSVEPFAAAAGDADLLCCPMFPLKERLEELLLDAKLDAVNAPNAGGDRYANFLYQFTHQKQPPEWARINSGIQIVGKRLLNAGFREALLDLATARAYPNEQSVLTDFFKKNKDYKLKLSSPVYNFKSSFLDKLTIPQALCLMPAIANIHYIGAAKPWLKPVGARTGITHFIWWKYAVALSRNRKLFAIPKGELESLAGAEPSSADGPEDME